MKNIELSDNQKIAVQHKEGAILVLASAGSGKTRILTERIKSLIPQTKRKILAITFTNKAGEEMRERLGKQLNLNEKLFIGTFHGFCQQVLENHGRHIGLDDMPHIFDDESERLELIEEAIEAAPNYYKQYLKLEAKEKRSFRYKVLEYISEVKRKILSDEQILDDNEGDEEIVIIYNTYQDILASQNAIDFDDLIMLAYNLLVGYEKVASLYRRMYEYICIDEAQDLNYAQYQLLQALTGDEHTNVMMVGDPNQSIFAFNGSSSEYMTKAFVEDYEPKIIDLKENYRSSKQVLKAAEKIIPNVSISMDEIVKEGVFEIYDAKDEADEAIWVCNKIQSLLSLKVHPDIEGEINYSKMAVLARNKYVFKSLTEELEKRSLAYHFKSTSGSVKFESKSMQIFSLALRLKLNNRDRIHKEKLRSALKLDSSFEDLTDLLELPIKPFYKSFISTVAELDISGNNFKKSLSDLKTSVELIDEIDDNNKNLISNDITELETHWYNYARKSDNKSIKQFITSMALGKTNSIIERNGITLSSIHTIKGQEYDIVFVIGMDDETFPDYRAIRKGGVELTQEKNNAYVAFTRARRFLYVSYPRKRLMPWGDIKNRTKSRFLSSF